MFELISQIPFHFTTSLCSLMDPIYYIYHKLYHIFGDHVGHCHQACLGVHAVAPGAQEESEGCLCVCVCVCVCDVPGLFQMHFFLSFSANKNRKQPVYV